jgi:hypothetical protein
LLLQGTWTEKSKIISLLGKYHFSESIQPEKACSCPVKYLFWIGIRYYRHDIAPDRITRRRELNEKLSISSCGTGKISNNNRYYPKKTITTWGLL